MIKVLSEDTIQKIAAGEVVERPASIIKELVENSIDAKADEITVHIKNGGKSYLKVTDNGSGIPKDQVEMAFLRHATSKISDFDDLYKIYTMGFRGEALASIVAVSKLNVFTKTRDEKTGLQLSYDNNKLIEKKNTGMNDGTIIEVSDLFKYIPVRQKFLGSDMTESNKITAMMYSFAIANTGISFSYIKDDKVVFNTNKNSSLKDNLTVLFGNDYTKNIIQINNDIGEYKVSGYASNNRYYKGNRSMQYIFVNGRYIDNTDLVTVIESQYHSIIPNGRFPAFQLFIETDPKNIDINISPNKQKIKFSFQDELLEMLKNTIINALIESQKIKEIEGKKEKSIKPNFYELNKTDSYQDLLDSYKPVQKGNLDNIPNLFSTNNDDIEFDMIDLDEDILDNDLEAKYTDNISDQINTTLQDNILEDKEKYIESEIDLAQSFIDDEFSFIFIGQIFKKYVLFNDTKKNQIIIMNLQAANERLIYDKLSSSLSEKIPVSDLLQPIIIDLSTKDSQTLSDNMSLFESLGYSIDNFGNNTIAIRSVPYLLEQPTNKDFFLELLDSMKVHFTRDKINEIFVKRANAMSSSYIKNIDQTQAIFLYQELKKSSNMFATQYGKKIIYSLDESEFERLLK
ncbi:MAG: DNA mismatch repair endonuclease MutL [Tissierellia bacterium]|nr:DNA mismatch repair endonuclease MutL [Tissierellia bacterium]